MKLKKEKAEKKKEVPPTQHFEVQAFMDQINKNYGVGTIFRASEAAGLTIRRLPTGCARIDLGLGGGLPLGRMIEIFGNESAGKSTLLYATMTQFLRMFGEGLAVLLDLERTFDPDYALGLGIDLDRLLVINPDYGEQASDLLNEVMKQKTDLIVGVDSIAAMVPNSTLEISAEKMEMGVHARLINRVMAKCNARMKRNLTDENYPTTTVIFINQERQKITMFGDPNTTPGGLGKNFFTSVRIKLHSTGSEKNKVAFQKEIGGVKKEILVGRVVSFQVVKNKTGGTPFEDGEYRYWIKPYKGYPAWSFDNADALFEAGRFHGCIRIVPEKKGVRYEYGEFSTKMPHLFVKELIDNKELYEAIYVEVLDAVTKFNAGEMTDEAEQQTTESTE